VEATQTTQQVIFNGKHTLISPTGDHRTFRIRTARKGALESKRIVGLLTGPDNGNDYKDFAFLTNTGISVWIKCQSSTHQFEKLAKCLWDMMVNGENGVYGEQGMTILTSKRCVRCNRELTHPDSIKSGIGPECAQKI
jgi:hypothetical protein